MLNRSARPVPIMEQLQTNSGLINELVNYDNIPDKPYKEVLKKIKVILTNHLGSLQRFCNLPAKHCQSSPINEQDQISCTMALTI